MRVLLVGEYSGLHNSLKNGLAALGIECVLASDGDAWKAFPSDVNFASPFSATSIAGRVFKNVKPFVALPDPAGFDVVQLVSPMILTPRLGINRLFVEKVARRSSRLFVLAAGDDCFYFKNLGKFRYNPVDDYREIDLKGRRTPWDDPGLARLNEWLAARVDGIIPVAYEYAVGYTERANCRPVIPMPIDLAHYTYAPNRVNGKVVFLHGINRPGFKGSKYILEAFARAEERWGAVAEFVTVTRLAVDRYVEALRGAHVIVDQALSYSYAMNALISMAMGRVVMSGAEPEAVAHLPDRCPVVNILPDPDQICGEIERLIGARETLEARGREGREFVEHNHDHVRVAQRFVEAWSA